MRFYQRSTIFIASKKITKNDPKYYLKPKKDKSNDPFNILPEKGDYYYIPEPIEETKRKISNAFAEIGCKLINIIIKLYDEYLDGNALVYMEYECDNIPPIGKETYIRGVKGFHYQDETECLLQIYFTPIDVFFSKHSKYEIIYKE